MVTNTSWRPVFTLPSDAAARGITPIAWFDTATPLRTGWEQDDPGPWPEIDELPVGHDSPATTLSAWLYVKYGGATAPAP